MKSVFMVLSCLIFLSNSPADQSIDPKKPKKMKSIYELAINQSKEGKHEEFLKSREAFVEVLGKEKATLNEGKWLPFFTVAPDLDLNNILIGMTHWNSLEGFGEAAGRLMPQPVASDYFASFNQLAYALLEPVDGKSFDMNSIKRDGLVVEFAIRKGKKADAFGQKRETFFKSLEEYDGYQFAREFKVHKLSPEGVPALAENTQAVIIVWENAEKFQAAAQPVFASDEYQQFAANLDVETYFASSPIE